MAHVRPGPIGQAGASVLLNVMAVSDLEQGLVPPAMMRIVPDLPFPNNIAIGNRVDVKCCIGIISCLGAIGTLFKSMSIPAREPFSNNVLTIVTMTTIALPSL